MMPSDGYNRYIPFLLNTFPYSVLCFTVTLNEYTQSYIHYIKYKFDKSIKRIINNLLKYDMSSDMEPVRSFLYTNETLMVNRRDI